MIATRELKNGLIKILFALCVISNLNLSAQSRIITGQVINEELEVLQQIRIQNSDTVLITTTDGEGKFEINLAPEINKLLLSGFGMEWTTIKIPQNNCDHFDIIMMSVTRYDLLPEKKAEKLRVSRKKRLRELYMDAFEMDLFRAATPCMTVESETNRK